DSRLRLPACQWTPYHSQHVELRKRRSGDEQLLIVRIGVRRRDREPLRRQLQQVVGQDAIQHLAVSKLHPHPEAVRLGACIEYFLLLAGLNGTEISNKTNHFDV